MRKIKDMTMMLKIEGVNHGFENTPILHDINIQIMRGSFVALVGGSGAGKTTLLKAILGTHPPNQGGIYAGNREVVGPGRDVGIVYQKYTLFPHLTVLENVAEGLKLDQTSIPFRIFHPIQWRKMRKQHLKESKEILEKVNLGHALNRYPNKLSGGMQQRAAICQALIMEPDILLLDEPFGALDQHTREELQDMILGLYQENLDAKRNGEQPPYTLIVVTHELREAFLLADRVIGLSKKWKDGEKSGETHGATVIFDKTAPIFAPEDERDYNQISHLTDLCFNVVIADDGVVYRPEEHRTFWDDISEGLGTGVSALPSVDAEK